MLSILQNAGEIETDPYPHIVIEKALPDDLYRALLATRPHWNRIRALSGATQGQNTRHDMSARMLLRATRVWREFVAYHTSLAFYVELLDLFGLPANRLPSVGPRNMGDYTVQMDCQIGINTPVTEKSKVRSPHLDNPIQIFGGMLYMPIDDDGGDFIIYKLIKRPEIYGKAEIMDHCVEEVKRVPYKYNTAVFFLNQENAVHGVSEREVTESPRQLVNFISESREKRFDPEQYRVEPR